VSARAVVVTGAARGIGAEIARRLVGAGARVFATDVDRQPLEETAATFGEPARVATVAADVSVWGEVEALQQAATARFGPIDAVIHCAGIVAPDRFISTDVTSARRLIEINLLGSIHVARSFLPGFVERRAGHLLLMGSMGGYAPMPNEVVYSATKFAIRGLALALAMELRGTGVHVTLVAPDSVATRMLQIEATRGGSPLAFWAAPLEPGDVAAAVLRTLEHPRLEVLIPRVAGTLIKLLNLSPRVMMAVYPLLSRLGARRQAAFARQFGGGQ
jgi:short-subunit dehydrogenase